MFLFVLKRCFLWNQAKSTLKFTQRTARNRRVFNVAAVVMWKRKQEWIRYEICIKKGLQKEKRQRITLIFIACTHPATTLLSTAIKIPRIRQSGSKFSDIVDLSSVEVSRCPLMIFNQRYCWIPRMCWMWVFWNLKVKVATSHDWILEEYRQELQG
jgi:hypothetical protein